LSACAATSQTDDEELKAAQDFYRYFALGHRVIGLLQIWR
jgi:hypothetical protein